MEGFGKVASLIAVLSWLYEQNAPTKGLMRQSGRLDDRSHRCNIGTASLDHKRRARHFLANEKKQPLGTSGCRNVDDRSDDGLQRANERQTETSDSPIIFPQVTYSVV